MTSKPEDHAWGALWKDRCDVLNLANITYRYHRKREAFFDRAEKLTQAATVLAGLSLLGKTVQEHIPIAASVISGLGLLALVFGYSERRQLHRELGAAACNLAGEIEGLPLDQLDEQMVQKWRVEMVKINTQEPPNLMGLVKVCEYEQAKVEGHKDHIKRPGLWQRMHAHFF